METLLVLLAILAATIGLGCLVRRWERRHPPEITQTQVENFNDMVKRMKVHRKDGDLGD